MRTSLLKSPGCNYCVVAFQDDQYWFQARKEVDKTTRAGLIPSRALQERRIIHERTQMAREMSGSESKSEKNFNNNTPQAHPFLDVLNFLFY
jgi:hypothetical protein